MQNFITRVLQVLTFLFRANPRAMEAKNQPLASNFDSKSPEVSNSPDCCIVMATQAPIPQSFVYLIPYDRYAAQHTVLFLREKGVPYRLLAPGEGTLSGVRFSHPKLDSLLGQQGGFQFPAHFLNNN